MRVKSFFISFLFVLSFSFLFAETVTLKTYPTIQTDPERNFKNAEMKLVYDTDDNELYMFFVEDYGWASRYWFEVGIRPKKDWQDTSQGRGMGNGGKIGKSHD